MTWRRARAALIVDDEDERRAEMRDGLLDHGVACDEAATLADAIRRLTSTAYDLVVCDMVLCDPPGAPNPALRGYLAVCFALATRPAAVVVQASSVRRWAHPGSVLAEWSPAEVADAVYGGLERVARHGDHSGCPWLALERAAAAGADRRVAAVRDLARLPIVRELEDLAGLGPALEALEDAAHGASDWPAALRGARQALFPGALDAR